MEPAQLSDQVRVGHLGAAGQHQVLTRPAPRTAPKGRETTVGKSQKTPSREFDCITCCVPPPPPPPTSLPSLSATLVFCKCKESIHCPSSYLFENGICSCGDKLHGAPRWETGQFCPILAVPLGTATINRLGHFVFCSCFGIYYHI